MRKIAIAVAIVMTAGLAVAEPSAKYAEWAQGPVKFLLTPEEVTQWSNVKTDAEAEAFIALFWAKRDPSPPTPANEFRMEFDNRVALADQHFTTKRTRGALTDRGRALILLGSPWQVGSKGAARGAAVNPNLGSTAEWDGAVRGPRGESAMLTWTYAHDKKPKWEKRKDFMLVFVDDSNDGQWQFARSDRLDHEATLAQAARENILHAGLTKAPEFDIPAPATEKVASLKSAALASAYKQFRDENQSSMGPALLTWGQYVTPDGEIFVPVQLYAPQGSGIDAGRKLTFFGVVENNAQEIVSVFEEPVTVEKSLRDAYVDRSLSLQPGTYKATIGLADNDKVVTMASANLTIDKLDPAESAISPMILSNNSFALAQAQLITDPFAFGGLKVVPKGDAQFSPSDDIWYFFELRNPGVNDSGMPKIQAKIEINGKDDQQKAIKKTLPFQDIETIPMKGVKNHYGLVMGFPLKDFAPGQYTVKIKVLDTVLKKSYEAERAFTIKL